MTLQQTSRHMAFDGTHQAVTSCYRFRPPLLFLLFMVVLMMVSTPPPATANPSHPQITRPTHPASPRTGHPTGFTNPVTRLPRPNRVLRTFNKPAKNWLPGHRGVDLEAAPTDPIYAAGDGTVIYAGTLAGIPTVSIEHPGGLRTTYQPVLPRAGRHPRLPRIAVGRQIRGGRLHQPANPAAGTSDSPQAPTERLGPGVRLVICLL